MRYETTGPIQEAEISLFEAEIGFKLPIDYRNLLVRYNGVIFPGAYPPLKVPNLPTLCVRCLFGLKESKALDLRFWHQRLHDDIPSSSVVIGRDPGGAFFLLICDGPDQGVYFYDHAHDLESSDEERNTYNLAADFPTFARLIGLDHLLHDGLGNR